MIAMNFPVALWPSIVLNCTLINRSNYYYLKLVNDHCASAYNELVLVTW